AARRSRGRRQRSRDRRYSASEVPCPLSAVSAEDIETMNQRWASLEATLREQMPPAVLLKWETWTAGIHAHRFDDELIELGVIAAAMSWTPQWRRASDIAGRPV